MTIKIKYFNKNMTKLSYIGGNKSNWIDLYTSETTVLAAGDYTKIPLGVAMELPEGYEAYIVPRSSTFEKYGILQTNSEGIIDNSYKGDNDMWMLPVYATRDTVIPENIRICQFRIMKRQPNIKFEEVENLEAPDRGGFGSTGV